MGSVVDSITNIVTDFIGWLLPIPEVPEFGDTQQVSGVLINKQSNDAQIPVVYGRRKVGITRVFVESSGTNNEYLYVAGVVCEGEIEEIEQIYIDDKRVIFNGDLDHGVLREVVDGDINFYKDSSHIQVQAFYGTDSQVASSVLTPSINWTSNHRLRGVCYLAFRFKWNSSAFSSIPDVKVILKGRKVYDPRDTTTKYTQNSSLILLDYLRNTRYGKGLPNDAFESDFASFKTSADEADTLIVPITVVVTPVAGITKQDFNEYYADKTTFFTNKFPTNEQKVVSISNIGTGQRSSDRFFGYINAPSTATFDFQTDSDDASHVYIGDNAQTVDNLMREIEANRASKLIVNNGGTHANRTISGSKSLTNGGQYPIIIYFGNLSGDGNLTFQWRVSAGTYSTDLSGIFSTGENTTDEVPAIIKFETNAVLDTNQKVLENVKKLLNPMSALFTYNNGVYKVKIEGTGSAIKTITSDHVVGGAKVLGERKNNKYNRVIGTFVNPFKNYQNDTVTFPPADDANVESEFKHATMLANDNNTLLEGNFQFPNVTNTYNAEALCEIILRRSRNQLQIQLTLTSEFLELEIGDIVAITYPSGGFDAKPFRVLGLTINEDLTVNVQLFEHQDNFYTFNEKNIIPTIADTILPNPYIVQAPVMIVSDVLRALNEEAINTLLVEVSATDQFIVDFEVQAKKSTDTNYINLGRGASSNFELTNVEDNAIYDVRARSVSSISRSVFISAQHQVVGKTVPPADVTNFQINIVNTEAHLSWTPVPDLDLSHYIIRHSPLTSGATFNNSITLIDKVSRPANSVTVPAMTGTYFIRAVDKIQLLSLNATSNVALIENIKNLNLIATSTQNPDFTGTKTNVVAIEDGIILNTTNNFDDVAGNFDDALGYFDGGNGSVVSSGIYDFDAPIDVGGVYTNRITARVESERVDYVNTFDDASGNFDAREGLFEGTATAFGNTNVEFQIATTQTDPASGSPTFTAFQKFIVGDYKARGFKFRAILTSVDLQATPKITQLSVTVDMPERTYSENDIASGTDTSGKVVTFTPAFKAIQGVGISASNLASGDYYAITSKSATGFTIEFFNSSNATIDRTFDYVVRGYGELAS
jgi:hypothetical protein